MKKCPDCKQEKEDAAFGKNHARYDGLANYCRECRHAQEKEPIRKVKSNRRKALWRHRRKLLVLAHYGPSGEIRCSWPKCTINDPDMLTVDHVNDDGWQQRVNNPHFGGDAMYRFLKKNWPINFQTLCANHQLKKEIIRVRENGRRTTATRNTIMGTNGERKTEMGSYKTRGKSCSSVSTEIQ